MEGGRCKLGRSSKWKLSCTNVAIYDTVPVLADAYDWKEVESDPGNIHVEIR
jgi:hypothetical protein